MFGRTKLADPNDELIAIVRLELEMMGPHHPDFVEILGMLERLETLRQANRPIKLDPNTALLALTNISGVLIVTKYEQLSVLTSKAVSSIPRLFK